MNTREFLKQIDGYNARVREAEKTLRELQTERDVLRAQASDFMRVKQFDAEVSTFHYKFTFADQPPAPTGEQGEAAIVRHEEKAAE